MNARLHNDHARQDTLANLGDTLREVGALREAEGVLRQALAINHKLNDEFQEGISLRFLGQVLDLGGDHSLGCVLLSRIRRLPMKEKGGDRQLECVTNAYLAERRLQLGDFVNARTWAERAWERAAVQRVERDFTHAAFLQGRIALGLGDFVRANERLHHALNRARAVNLVQLELPALIAIAELDLHRGPLAEAKARLDDVWEAAERGPYPLHQSDAYNVLADIARAEADKPAAIAAAADAYRLAWCDGPPYAYHWGLAKAKAHLAALGAPEPDMPPFDESKFEPMPEAEINPKDKYWVDPNKLE